MQMVQMDDLGCKSNEWTFVIFTDEQIEIREGKTRFREKLDKKIPLRGANIM